MPGCAYTVGEHDGARLECDAKHSRVVFVGDILNEVYELGTEHLLDPGADHTVVDAMEGSGLYGAAGLSEQSSCLEDLGIETADELDRIRVHDAILIVPTLRIAVFGASAVGGIEKPGNEFNNFKSKP